MGLQVRGTVGRGSERSYAFGDAAAEPSQPVSRAKVRLFFMVNEPKLRCDAANERHEAEVETDAHGHFELPEVTVGGVVGVDTYFGICVTHAGYEDLAYVRKIGEGNSRDYTGWRYFNVVLAPRPAVGTP